MFSGNDAEADVGSGRRGPCGRPCPPPSAGEGDECCHHMHAVPDPELIESCCHHLLLLIPLQYLCLRQPHPGGGGGTGWWGAGQKASVAPGPAASAAISHFPARGGIRFLPKVAVPAHCQSRHCPPPVPTVPPARLLAVCDPDTTRLGSVINPLPARPTPIQPCRVAD